MKTLFQIILTLSLLSCSPSQDTSSSPEKKDSKMIQDRISQFIPVEIKYDTTLLSAKDKIVLNKLYLASKIMDDIFLNQVYSKNEEIKNKLRSSDNIPSQLQLEYFNMMAGPFDRLESDEPFIGNEPKPLGANFYPGDMTREEFTGWIKNHPEDEKNFTSEFTVIRRDGEKLIAIPYSEFYKDKLTDTANLLREAANQCNNESLKNYLTLRAKAFESNDYFESDLAWMDVKNNLIEVVIGPYEVYEDGLFNYKASFESFLTLKDSTESKKLEVFAKYLKELEMNLPLDEKYKNFSRGSESPIVVVNQVYNAGDSKAGVQTLAFNLPNDERVRSVKGSKKVMLKNIHEAKFEKLLLPIAELVLDKSQLQLVTFDAFFNHTLMHEMSHGIGPGFIEVNGIKTEVKKELKETYSTLEECKADILGMYNNIFMINQNIYPKEFAQQLWVTFLAGVFRSVRFGIGEAHGGGNAIIFNYLLEKNAYQFDEANNTVKVNFDNIYSTLEELANIVLTIQATGNYKQAKDLIEKYAVNSEVINILREKISHLPIDIRPVFQIENEHHQN
jgi:hypothetical protein